MRRLPNYITIFRVFCSVLMALFAQNPVVFYSLYFLCGISDMLDGFLARKMQAVSKLGATLDSVADAVFIASVCISVLPQLQLPLWVLVWVAVIAVLRGTSLLVGYLRHKTLLFLHTYANKATGLLLFFFPLWLWLLGVNLTAMGLCIAASISALEELSINAISKKADRNISSVLQLKRDAAAFKSEQ
ncbi:MAG: CDP-alcohol phosphatidyltransferase family protein [Oscillospiraceae bacterium]